MCILSPILYEFLNVLKLKKVFKDGFAKMSRKMAPKIGPASGTTISLSLRNEENRLRNAIEIFCSSQISMRNSSATLCGKSVT
jgi:hypothetical protein